MVLKASRPVLTEMEGVWFKYSETKTTKLQEWAKCAALLTKDAETQARMMFKYAQLLDPKENPRKFKKRSFKVGMRRCAEDIESIFDTKFIKSSERRYLVYHFKTRYDQLRDAETAYKVLTEANEDCNKHITLENAVEVCRLCVSMTFTLVITETTLIERDIEHTYGEFAPFLLRNITFGEYISAWKSKFHGPIQD